MNILKDRGLNVVYFSPIVPLCQLTKTIVTTENNGYRRCGGVCGGINISDEYINEKMRFGHWKDTGFMLRGEAVAGFTAMFLEMWNVNDEHIEELR